MKKKVSPFRKLAVLALTGALALAANAGTWIVHVRMHDNTTLTLELASLPTPDLSGMYRLHLKDQGDIVVHAANVWIVEKSNRAKAKK